MIAVAINDRSSTYGLVERANEFVLSVPGEGLATEAMFCGHESMRDGDKVARLGLELSESQSVSVPGLSAAIANVELKKRSTIECGDHVIVVGEVTKFRVNATLQELPLLSIGPFTNGYKLLCKKGMHRLGVVTT
jgi:flavin reductase (DIM6/NTAB) family NADH-FMN oxidoreductase RutF